MTGGKLYDKYGNLTFFADVTGLEDVTRTGADKESTVKAHSRDAFMGDPAPSSVGSHTRNFSVKLRQAKGAVPGYTVTLESGTEKRQFQWTGTMSALVAFLKSKAKVATDLYGPTGAPYDTIPAASGG